jgi:DNA-directed RNA polymerase subunit RPC12/RpoP
MPAVMLYIGDCSECHLNLCQNDMSSVDNMYTCPRCSTRGNVEKKN